jgi:predicted O-methyltransferase YrrM
VTLEFTKNDKIGLLAVGLLLSLFSVGGWFWLGEGVFAVIIPIGIIAILAVQLDSLRKINKQRRKNSERLHETYFAQVESLLTVHSLISEGTPPLPASRGWAASPDFIHAVCSLLHSETPNLVLELGSGLSTIVSGHCLESLNKGRLVALDHEEKFAKKTRRHLHQHALEERTHVVHAPLRSYELNRGEWQWYDLGELEVQDPIDFVIVDGPPAVLQDMSRYPAIPLLFEQLGDDAVLIVDDGSRQEEERIVNRWLEQYSDLEAEFMPLEMGAYVLRRT